MIKSKLCKVQILFYSLLFFIPQLVAQEYNIGLAVWSGYPECVQGFKDALAKSGLKEGKQVNYIYGDIGADKLL